MPSVVTEHTWPGIIGPTLKTPSFSAVSFPSSVLPGPLITENTPLHVLPLSRQHRSVSVTPALLQVLFVHRQTAFYYISVRDILSLRFFNHSCMFLSIKISDALESNSTEESCTPPTISLNYEALP